MVLFNMHSGPSELVIRFPPDVPFPGAHDLIGAVFRTDRNYTISETLADSPDRTLREGVARINDQYASGANAR
jgi:hypothetical protein